MNVPEKDDVLEQLNKIIAASGDHIVEIYLNQEYWSIVFPHTKLDTSLGRAIYRYKDVAVTGRNYFTASEQAMGKINELAELMVNSISKD